MGPQHMSYPGGYGGPDSGAEDEEISLNQNIIRGSGSQSRERACDGCRRSSSRFYESNKLCVWITGGVVFLISIILFACSFDVVKPTQFGLFQNGWSGSVDTSYVYDAGRYFVWLRNFFITVPAYRVNIEFSAATSALLVNKAKTDGFYIQQSAKAESYAELANLLQLTKKEVLDYVKIHSLTGGLDSGRTAQTVVGTAQPSMVMG